MYILILLEDLLLLSSKICWSSIFALIDFSEIFIHFTPVCRPFFYPHMCPPFEISFSHIINYLWSNFEASHRWWHFPEEVTHFTPAPSPLLSTQVSTLWEMPSTTFRQTLKLIMDADILKPLQVQLLGCPPNRECDEWYWMNIL